MKRPYHLVLLIVFALAIATPLLLSGSLAKTRKPPKQKSSANEAKPEAAQPGDLSPATMDQIVALEAEKATRTPAEQKIDSQLLQAVRESRGQQMAKGVQLARAEVKTDDAGRLAVDIAATVDDILLEKIERLGGESIYPSWEYKTIRANVPLSAIETIAGYGEVKFIQEAVGSATDRARPDLLRVAPMDLTNSSSLIAGPVRPLSLADRAKNVRRQLRSYLASRVAGANAASNFMPFAGTIISEGDRTHRADDTRNTYGYMGQGIKIGVLSDSFNHLNGADADVASGNLPGPGNPVNTTPVTVVQDLTSSGSDEGRAMLQIIHDLAPKAQLFFATADVSEAGFATNILALRNTNGCDIIVDDVFYFDESPFQDGIVAQAVNSVTTSGALYFSSAGNAGSVRNSTSGVYEGDFNDAGSPAFSATKAGTIHNFGTVGSPVNGDIITSNGLRHTLHWSDPWGASSNDYDLFLVSSGGTVKSSSTNLQNGTGTQNPFEQITPPALVAGDRLVVLKTTGAAVRAIHLNTQRGTLIVATTGQTHGHASALDAFAVAATPAIGPFPSAFSSSNHVESFSSDGPRRIFYNSDGSPITAGNVLFGTNGGTLRQKPDLTAADGVSTTLAPGGGLNPFFGTSAAAPHAGAIAALIKSANPSLTPSQIRSILTSTAIDIENSGNDINSGAGIIQAFQAMQSVNPTAMANLNLGTSSITEGTGNGNGAIDPGESGSLVFQITNPSSVAATGVSVTLTSPTSGVNITHGSASFGTIAPSGNATNSGGPFTFTVDPNTPCGTILIFALNVNFGGGNSPQGFFLSKVLGSQPGGNITSTLGQTPPNGPGFTSTSGNQTNRINRANGASSCAMPKATPAPISAGLLPYHAYTFTNQNSTSQCVTVTLTSSIGMNLYTAAYNSSGFNSADPTANYLADPGSSAATERYSFTAPANQQFTVVVHNVNASNQEPYTLNVSLSNCAAFSPTPSIQFSAAAASVGEGDQVINLTVTRSSSGGTSTVDYTTSDTAGSQSCNIANGKASSRCDYISSLGTLTFAPGETSKTIPVLIIDDSFAEGSENFNVTLSNPTGSSLGATTTETVTINDNEGSTTANPIDQSAFFVRENYFDFLNRVPDSGGLDFWTNEIASCGSNQGCVDGKRVTVSAAFFISIEFQQTGYLVERMFKTAFGDAPGSSTFNGAHTLPVPIVRFADFLPDTQRIGQGVVVGVGDWQTQLENNKQAYALAFVQRTTFTNALPTSMTPSGFVDRLNQNAGLVLSPGERTTAISLFSGASDTSNMSARAQALRQIAEDQDLQNAEFNRAFVLMQYFGYLRRNPNDTPDSDYSGFDFWLTKLNQFNGNYVDAEMVKAFITSAEYRQRFGP